VAKRNQPNLAVRAFYR